MIAKVLTDPKFWLIVLLSQWDKNQTCYNDCLAKPVSPHQWTAEAQICRTPHKRAWLNTCFLVIDTCLCHSWMLSNHCFLMSMTCGKLTSWFDWIITKCFVIYSLGHLLHVDRMIDLTCFWRSNWWISNFDIVQCLMFFCGVICSTASPWQPCVQGSNNIRSESQKSPSWWSESVFPKAPADAAALDLLRHFSQTSSKRWRS